MKIVKFFIILSFVLLVIGAIGLFIFIKTFHIDRYKPLILKTAQDALGREVNYSSANLHISLSQGVAIKLNHLTIADSPDYHNDNFFQVDEISLGVDILSYIQQKKIQVSTIYINSPKINIVRRKDGRLNVEDLGKPSEKTDDQDTTVEDSDKGSALPLIFINSFIVKGAVVRYIDKTSEPEIDVEVSKIDFETHGFSLTGRMIPFQLDLALLSDNQNIHCTGTIKPDSTNQQVSLSPLDINVDLSQFSFDKIRSSFPMIKKTSLPSTLNGQFRLSIHNITKGANGLVDLNADAEVSNGAIVFNDMPTGARVEIDQISFGLKNISLDKKVTYSLKLACLSEVPNISVTGQFQLDSTNKGFDLSGMRITSDLSLLSMAELKNSVASLKDADLPDKLKGSIYTIITKLRVADKKLVALNAEGDFAGGELVLNKLPVPVENINAIWQIDQSDVNISNISMKIGNGTIKGGVSVKNYLTDRQFNMDLHLNRLDLSELIEQDNEEVKIEGKLTGSFNMTGDASHTGGIIDSLDGDGNVTVSDGKLTDINILKIVLGKLSMFPHLPEILEAGLPRKYKEKIAKKDTILTKVDLNVAVENNEILITPITVLADNFIFEGHGKALFDKTFTLKGSFYVPADLSLSMVERLDELQYILDEKNRIFIPLQVLGNKTAMRFLVDVRYLAKKVMKIRGRKELDKVLDKVFEKKEPSQPSQDPHKPDDKQAQEEQSIEEQIIDGILDRLFDME